MTARFEWMDDALCAEVGGDMFFPEVGGNDTVRVAKSVCDRCAVAASCAVWLAGFSDAADRYGIAGAMSPRGRRLLRRHLSEQTEHAA